MNKEPHLKYHHAIFDLLGKKPIISPKAQTVIEEREKVCRVSFPASVKEYFSIQDAAKLFESHTNADHLAELDELGRPEEVAKNWLHVATENQAVVSWFVRLDGSDDPQVFHDNDQYWTRNDQGEYVATDVDEIEWQFNSATFTNFVFDMISQYAFGGWGTGRRFEADDQAPDEALLSQLMELYQEGPRTDLLDDRVYRFFHKDGMIRIEIHGQEEMATGKAHWTIKANSEQSLRPMINGLWHYGTLAQTLTGESGSHLVKADHLFLEQIKSELTKPFFRRSKE
jgi:hypothetical protein